MIEILFWKKTDWDFMGIRRIVFSISGVLCLIGILAVIQIVRGVAPVGIDFAGGFSMNVVVRDKLAVDTIRNAFASRGIRDVQIMEIQSERGQRLLIKLREHGQRETVESILWSLVGEKPGGNEATIPGGNVQVVGATQFAVGVPTEALVIEGAREVGPAVGRQLQKKAAYAVFWAVVMILIYIWIRFEYRWGVAAAVAMAHDVLVIVGIMYVLQKDFTLLTLTALLTLAGYSLTDTVVVYDRIRENLRIRRNEGLEAVANASINEVLSRTAITSLTTLIPLVALLAFGSQVTFDFSLALAMGVIVGTYSSWFVASPLIVEWEKYRRRRAERAAISGRLKR